MCCHQVKSKKLKVKSVKRSDLTDNFHLTQQMAYRCWRTSKVRQCCFDYGVVNIAGITENN